mmetsp:Transcript_41249/g.124726  ORF Transcript_41249/g.124726 Transcript_41249/m.124726 type:complete len:220 (+) Transcript_41249:1636-2295(+)
MDQCVYVAVTVRLGLDLVRVRGVHSDPSVVVDESGDAVALLDEGDLIPIHTEVIVLLQEGDGRTVGITGCHYAKGELGPSRGVLGLVGQDGFDVVLNIARLGSEFGREANLDVSISQSFSQTPRHEDETAPSQFLPPHLLRLLELFRTSIVEILPSRDRRLPTLERIDASPRFIQQVPRVGNVSHQPAGGVRIVNGLEAGHEGSFRVGVRGGGGGPPGE